MVADAFSLLALSELTVNVFCEQPVLIKPLDFYRESKLKIEDERNDIWYDWFDEKGRVVEGKEPWLDAKPPPDLYQYTFEQRKKLERINRSGEPRIFKNF